MNSYAIDLLLTGRRIANYAKNEGALIGERCPRATCEHLGAVLADSVLQAGLNYITVVRPRVLAILRKYPYCDTISSLTSLIEAGETCEFLNWRHHEKIRRFEALVNLLKKLKIEDVKDLRSNFSSDVFCDALQEIDGIGPKTVDYMACLIGIESIAVDRHVRAFAKAVGIKSDEYNFLRDSFCCAADLLSLSRREFDAWLWRRAAMPSQQQIAFAI